MKTLKNNIILINILFLFLGLGSCESYLDKAPDSDITDENVFTNFKSFQGFVEELYCCMPDMTKSSWTSEWNWADELVIATNGSFRTGVDFDAGNYWAWQTTPGWDQSWLDQSREVHTGPDTGHDKGLWPLSWYGIRKTNLGLKNIDKLVDATQEEKNVIKGQLLFFRGWFHFQLMSYWGGLPYIDVLLSSNEKLDLPRLSYRETALKAAKDLEEAAALLPSNWDNTMVGRATYGKNNQRITKSAALAALGKDLLYAASPMMNESSTGNNNYDVELAQRAAKAFGDVLKLSDSGEAYYQLMPFTTYKEIFSTVSTWALKNHPGGTEVILGPPSMGAWQSAYSLAIYFPNLVGGDKNLSSPTENYVKNFGMANGLPIDAAGSNFNPMDPWTDRDPRFYFDIKIDGEKMFNGTGLSEDYRYANLSNNGWCRNEISGSRTGYLIKKFITTGCNSVDQEHDKMNFIVPYIRLADVYLMYAEAVNWGYNGPQSSSENYAVTAAEAVNIVRNRAGVGAVDARYLGSKDVFMSELIRERAVELAFEGIRFMDLRRWNIGQDMKYRRKTALDFDRGVDGKPINLTERLILTRVVEKKHNWLPFPTDQVSLYPEFNQNPGW